MARRTLETFTDPVSFQLTRKKTKNTSINGITLLLITSARQTFITRSLRIRKTRKYQIYLGSFLAGWIKDFVSEELGKIDSLTIGNILI